jgi:hypothetical protein
VTPTEVSQKVMTLPTDDTDMTIDVDAPEPSPDTDTAPVDTDIPVGDTEPPPPQCPDVEGGSVFNSRVFSGSTVGADDTYLGSCAARSGGGDTTVRWEAPSDGCFVFSTLDSDIDTVMYMFDECGGDELACNDNVQAEEEMFGSEIHRELSQGEQLIIAIDGWNATQLGAWNLDISRGARLPTTSHLGDAIGTLVEADNLTPENGFDLGTGSCPGALGTSGDAMTYSWTAPEQGQYVFTNIGTDFDAVLSVHRPCEDYTVACSDASPDGAERITLSLDAHETVVLRIAGWALSTDEPFARGHFALQVELAE